MKKIFPVLLFAFLNACVDGLNGSYPSSSYPNNYPPQYPNQYPSGYGYPNYPNYPYPNGGYQYPSYPPRNNSRDHYEHDRRDHHEHDRHDHPRRDNNNRPAHVPPPPPPPPQVEQIKPSCPPGTNYNGRTCVIVDQRLRKPGGDGNINPCPKGMWNSGGTCVRDR